MKSTPNNLDVLLDQKIDYWKKQLIDLSKRNKLVNYKFTKSKSIKINHTSLEKILEDLYHEENVVIIDNGASPKVRQWLTTEDKETITKKLYTLYRQTKENFQELGINTCFVTIGTLKYKDADDPETFLEAPIFLFSVEIIRNGSKYEIVSGSEDLNLNPAIKEKLERDFRILLDEFKGENPLKYLDYLRGKIIEKSDWTISENVYIDLFNYEKYIMYEELKTHKKSIKDGVLIKAYIGDKTVLNVKGDPNSDEFNDATSLDVLPADSSQKRAIELAKEGATFVLQGPPGTGKSQTITNIISALIVANKKVLFVSQKMAALKVVEKKLKEIGLDRYSLNLHKYRGKKKEVVNQLWFAVNETPIPPQELEKYSFEDYLQIQEEINDYYKSLCQKHEPWNLSIFDIRGELAKLYDVNLLDMTLEDTLKLKQKDFLTLKRKLEQVDYYFQEFNDPFSHVLFKYREEKKTGLQEIKFNKELSMLISEIDCLNNSLSNLQKQTKLTLANFDDIFTLVNAEKQIKKITSTQTIPAGLVSSDFHVKAKDIKQLYTLLTQIDAVKRKTGEKVNLTFLEQDTRDAEYIFANTSFLRRLISTEYRSHKKRLSCLSNKQLSHADWLLLFGQKSEHEKLLKELEEFTQNKKTICALIRDCTNMQEVENMNCTASQLTDVFKLANRIDNISGYKIIEFLIETDVSFYKIFENINEIIQQINGFFDSEVLSTQGQIMDMLDKASDMRTAQNELGDLLAFKTEYSSLNKEIQSFGKKYVQNKANHKFSEVFLKSYYLHILDKITNTEKTKSNIPLKSQYNADHLLVDRETKLSRNPNKLVEKFRTEDTKVRNLWAHNVMAGIEKSKPKEIHLENRSSELSTLKREYEKKNRLKPIRELLKEIPDLAFALKPCFMMSPLSVSQYIDPDHIKFDVVIFDEASQIMPEDAVSCLIRAKQAIIVGDTQQLPPTSFFLNQDDENADEEIIDLESFLSQASIYFWTQSLNWHYRSKNENLIAFSNRAFYNNRLITFPNSKKDKTGLELVYVQEGLYDRGKSRKNTQEAKQVLREYQKLKTEFPEMSVGIIAFNIQQQTAIEDVFKEAGINIEDSVDSEEENLIIKNLETVQGDERDIIIISVGYGKDETGKFTYNFGPINKEGGFKRLNVAITRSRFKTIVVTSILPEELEDTKINAEGVRHLKDYLDYAKNGDSSKFCAQTNEASFDSVFEEAVYDELLKEGFEMSRNIGSSGYKIGIAIKHPENVGEYILGIECDGSQYRSSRYARDRDKIRLQTLENLGWEIHRIWSEDWLRNRDREIEKIRDKIQSVLLGKEDIEEHTPDERFSKVETITNLREVSLQTKYPEYKICQLSNTKINLEFYEGLLSNPQQISLLKTRLIKVLREEGPIEEELLFKRVANSIGLQKTGSRLRGSIEVILRDINRKERIYKYQNTLSMESIDKVSPVRASTEEQRPVGLIPKEEISTVIIDLLKNNFSTTKESLIRDVAQVYGLKRTGNKIDGKIEQAIDYLTVNGLIQENNGRIRLNKV